MTTEEGERARSEGADVDAPLSPKEGMELPVRNMSATNAAGGTFGLGIDQFELPKASVTKVARTDVCDPHSRSDSRSYAITQRYNHGACQVGIRVCELPKCVHDFTDT